MPDTGSVKPGSAPAAADLLAAARGLVPYLRDEAARCEGARRVSDASIARLRQAGLFKAMQPRRYGGYEMGWDLFAELVVEIASGCGSTGWVYSVVGGHGPVLARFGTTLMDEIWSGDADALVSSSRRAQGTLEPVAGGYRGGGLARFSSGCLNASWAIVEGMPVEGRPEPLTIVLPLAECEILDSWRAIGLAGTGSHDFIFRDRFIPAHRTWSPGAAPHGEALDGPIFRFPFLGGPFALPAVIVGVALAGLEHFVAMTHRRTGRRGDSLAETASMQMRIGESAVELDAALALMRAKLRELMAALAGAAPAPGPLLPAGGAAHAYDQAASSFVAHRAYGALNRLMEAAGAGQLALSEPFQRCFRDALAGIQQPSNNWDVGRAGAGRALLDRIAPQGAKNGE
jgi:3-hydroxy-9,10-secoandrosta-1,3,5(10)-triene-9,17-dione monooxygenase